MAKIYTKKGDEGWTQTLKGRVSKDDPRIGVEGALDTCNAYIGMLLAHLEQETKDASLISDLVKIQRQLFGMGMIITGAKPSAHVLTEEDVVFLEHCIDVMWEKCPPLHNFILPGGSMGAAYAHLCRVWVRDAERRMVALKRVTEGDFALLLRYINRLSDYFFALARYLNAVQGKHEVIWP